MLPQGPPPGHIFHTCHFLLSALPQQNQRYAYGPAVRHYSGYDLQRLCCKGYSPGKYGTRMHINLLLTEREGRTGEYWPEVVAVRTERSEVRTKTTEGQYSPVRLEQARLVSSLLYGTRVMLVSKLPAFENKKYTSYDHFHGNGPYGKIPTKKEPIRTPGFIPRLPCHIIMVDTARGWVITRSHDHVTSVISHHYSPVW